ncbi:MAG: hypothetical protein IT419_04835 [Planctomycetes bacterium]|nr:hypothetical protein [Planctomycetota bacterium]
MAAAVKGKGWVLEYGDSGGTPGTAIVGLRDCRGLEKSCEDIDTTTNDQADSTDEMEPGFSKENPVEIDMLFAKARMTTLESLYRVMKAWDILNVNGDKWTGEGYVSHIGTPILYRGVLQTTFRITRSGKWTYTASL